MGGLRVASVREKGQETGARSKEVQQRLDRAHQRYLSAVKTLATVTKLLKPSVSPLDLASRPVEETTASPFRRRATPVKEGVGVAN